MSQTRKSPAGTPGNLEKASNSQADFTTFLHSAQVCVFTGERIGKTGKPSCEFIKAGEA